MVGRVINNYKFISVLGEGGMGIIYRAYDTKLDRYVAVKILKPKVLGQEKFIERFRVEAKNQAKLSHQNIVPVYGFIEEGEVLGIVMEIVEGETLEQLLERKGKIDLSESIRIIKQVLTGIGFAHSRGFIHRDIKPSNIIISRDGIAKIMDFGISKSVVTQGITSTGTNVGTLYYMSPEQIKGEDLTIQSDIYSVGITLFELLTGTVPFQYDNEYQVIEGHLKEEPPSLLTICPELPLNIQKIIGRAINKKPKSRYSTDEEFLIDLDKLEAGINTFNSPRPAEKDRSTRKYKVRSLFFTMLIFLAVMGLIYFSFSQVRELWNSGFRPVLSLFKGKDDNSGFKPSGEIKWARMSSGTASNLNAIIFLNDSTGFCCGAEATLLITQNGGASWRNIHTPSAKELLSISANTLGHIFILNESAVYKSTDLGATWDSLNISGYSRKFYKIKFFGNSAGFILGSSGLILKTTDSGTNWKSVESRSGSLLMDIALPDLKNGCIVGWNGEILRTADEGETWNRQKPFTSNYLRAVKFQSPLTGITVGGGGEIYRTSDGGANWARITTDFSLGLFDIEFVDEKIAFIVGGQGKLMMSVDGGLSWTFVDTNIYAILNQLVMTSQKKLYAVGVNGTIVRL